MDVSIAIVNGNAIINRNSRWLRLKNCQQRHINCYKLRPRKHDRQYVNLLILMTLVVVRMLYKDSY